MWLIRNKDQCKRDDDELILSYRNKNDQEAVGILFNRYSHLVFGVCMKYLKDPEEARDAVLQIFEKLYTDLKKHDVQKFSFWLHRVAQNFCLMQLRSKQAAQNKADRFVRDEMVLMEYSDDIHHTSAYQKEAELTLLEEAIQSLHEEQRICIELFYLKEKCYNDISDLTGYDFKQVKSFIQNGKRNLKIYMENKNHAIK